MSELIPLKEFQQVLSLITEGRNRFYQQANTILTETYWSVGKYLTQKIAGEGWGKSTITTLAKWLKENAPHARGFSAPNLWRMRQFYDLYSSNEKLSPLVRELNWTMHGILITKSKSVEEHLFYALTAVKNRWSKRELTKQFDAGLFERTMLADEKLSPAVRELPQDVTGVFKDSYLVDFANLSEPHSEGDLQKAIVNNLKSFLIELGTGFTFVGEEVKLQVGNSDFSLDLLFYHRDLQCLVAFELKRGSFDPRDLGQLSFYLEALDRQEKRPHENPSIGVLLCRDKDDEVVEYALSRSLSPALVAKYETELLPKETLRLKMNELYEQLGGDDA